MDNTEQSRPLTQGERIVRTEFNPSKTGLVDQLKQKHAELIDLVASVPNQYSDKAYFSGHNVLQDTMRQVGHSIDHLEVSCMLAVKAATASLEHKPKSVAPTTGEPPAYLQRMQEELAQLDERIGKLHNFIATDKHLPLPQEERNRLRMQYDAMYTYSSVLKARIDFAKASLAPAAQ
jgi:hypothetical protein